MSGNWQRAWYPPEGRERQGRRGGRMGKVEEGVGARVRGFTTVRSRGAAGRRRLAGAADAGVMLPRFAVLCALSSLSGAEELGGIPGTVGGALTMNAGAYGRAIGGIVGA